ncbi:Hypothetical predicted protein [Paramuricea clavata]|uniref:Uncharacterized protein n=1 Tax=Paramuricea clavata TaxID=317549 RepID=A0A7D9J8A8_PARCT|nr:Hypothetical predicted protein [Paramuricea clavata]
MQLCSGFKIKSVGVRCFAFPPYIVTTKQNINQVQSTPNLWFYSVVDHDYLFPGYNVNECIYDSGFNGLFGTPELNNWAINCEPQMAYKTGVNALEIQPMNTNPFLHPAIQLIKQTEDFNFKWDAEDHGWIHAAMPYLTNHEVGAAANYFKANNDGVLLALPMGYRHKESGNLIANCYQYSETVPCNSVDKEHGVNNYAVASGNITFGGSQAYDRTDQNVVNRFLTCLNWSKVSSRVFEFKPNIMGYSPLDLGNVMAGWCGSNMWGHRTSPGVYESNFGIQQSANSRFGPTLYKGIVPPPY